MEGIRNADVDAFNPRKKMSRSLGCCPESSPATQHPFAKHLDDNCEMMTISPQLICVLNNLEFGTDQLASKVNAPRETLLHLKKFPPQKQHFLRRI
jgi:hypothetical protein